MQIMPDEVLTHILCWGHGSLLVKASKFQKGMIKKLWHMGEVTEHKIMIHAIPTYRY
jgi:hypothetical protein